MAKRRRFPLIRIVLTCTLMGVVAPKALRALASSDLFRVREVQLQGGRYLTVEEATEWTAVPEDAHLWDDAAGWKERLASHPLVRVADVRRRPPGTLVLVVEERQPVALAVSANLEPVDAEGHVLPLDPTEYGFDLPLLGARIPAARKQESKAEPEARLAKLAAETARLSRIDPEFLARVSELEVDEHGDLIARWGEPAVTFRFPAQVTAMRIQQGMIVLTHSVARTGGKLPKIVDLRFADQVVVKEP